LFSSQLCQNLVVVQEEQMTDSALTWMLQDVQKWAEKLGVMASSLNASALMTETAEGELMCPSGS
jgi:hypothetical protein